MTKQYQATIAKFTRPLEHVAIRMKSVIKSILSISIEYKILFILLLFMVVRLATIAAFLIKQL